MGTWRFKGQAETTLQLIHTGFYFLLESLNQLLRADSNRCCISLLTGVECIQCQLIQRSRFCLPFVLQVSHNPHQLLRFQIHKTGQRIAIRCEHHIQRPAGSPGCLTHKLQQIGVQHRAHFTIDFYRNKVSVNQRTDLLIQKAFLAHHVTPVTGIKTTG